jgi:hypothetical protein
MKTKIAAFIAVWICHLACADSATNIVRNSSFESGTVGWKLERGDATVESGDARTGKHFVRIVDKGEEDTHVFQSRHFPARPGGKYRASVQVRSKFKGGQGIYLAFFIIITSLIICQHLLQFRIQLVTAIIISN